jgi:hypothetical protein
MTQDILMAEAILGTDAQEFLNSELGQTILGFARMERDEAMEKLKTCAVWRKTRIRQLQNDIWKAESFEAWMVGLIQAGQVAIEQLENPE